MSKGECQFKKIEPQAHPWKRTKPCSPILEEKSLDLCQIYCPLLFKAQNKEEKSSNTVVDVMKKRAEVSTQF